VMLLNHLFEIAVGKLARSAWLEVRKSNEAARLLYKKLDFIQHSVRYNYYTDNSEDAVVLYRVLTS